MEENFNKHLGNKLKLRRLALGLTQTKVAKAINVTFQQIKTASLGFDYPACWQSDRKWMQEGGDVTISNEPIHQRSDYNPFK